MSSLNQITVMGRLGKDAEFRSLKDGGEVAKFSVATDEGYKDKDTGEWKPDVNWHNVVTYEPWLVALLKIRGTKGANVLLQGAMHYDSWRKEGEEKDRLSCVIKITRSGKFIFLDKAQNGADASSD